MTLNTQVSFRYYVFIESVLSTPNDLTLELTFNYYQSGIPSLDSSGLIKSSEIPQTYVKQICGKTTANNDIVINLSDLNDTNITEPENNNFLQYNASTNNWVNQAVTIDTTLASLSDVNVGSISSNQGLIYDNNKWTNQTISHLNLSNIGTNTHAQIDSFINSAGATGGIATLDSNAKLTASQIPTLAESNITGLVSDISACEKIANKGVQNGYIPSNTYDQMSNQYIDNSFFLNSSQYGVASGYKSIVWTNSNTQTNPNNVTWINNTYNTIIEFTVALRMNFDIIIPQKITQLQYTAYCTNNGSMGVDIYGTNDNTQFNIPYDVSNLTMLTKLNTSQYTFTNNQ